MSSADPGPVSSPAGADPRARAVWATTLALGLAIAIYAPILYFMVLHWRQVDDYSHGFFIAPLALFFAWERKRDLAKASIEGSWWGLLLLFVGLASLAVGRLGVELTTMRWGFVFTVNGLVLLLLGKDVFKILLFPLLFLFLMVPLPQTLVNIIAFPLQLIAASFAVEVLHILRIPALLEGNIIHLASTQLFVADACSGLRSVMALITLGVVFAYFFRKSNLERLILIASTIPIAILVNAMRVALTGVLTHYFGEAAASGFIHEFQGVITFVVAFFLLLAEARAIDWLGPRMRARTGAGGAPA